ncbi:MAG: hypothetical protein HC901_02780 [Bdellovibrionaceae bacterium]|nr:hypothetical protein [Pseudobdellovibrionaceae bacterium]
MLEVLEQLVENQTIPAALAAKLKALTPGTVCQHKSWGIGKIQTWDMEGGRMLIDFQGKAGHPLEFSFAAASLRPFDADHIETRILSEPEAVRAQAQEDPVGLMAQVVKSLGAGATADRIEATLSPRLIPAAGWKKWWDGAKRAMRQDARFEVPVRRNLALVFHDEALDIEARVVDGVLQGVGPKAKTKGLEQLIVLWRKSPQPEAVDGIIAEVDATLAKVPTSQSHAALELIMARRDFLLLARPGSPSVPQDMKGFLPTDPSRFMATIGELPAAKQGRCVALAREYFGERWADFASQLLSVANSKVAEVVIEGFREAGRVQEAVVILERLVAERKLNYDFLIWLCRNRKGEFGRLVDANLFYTILSVLEIEQLGGSRKAGRLERLLFSDKTLVGDMLETATQEQVREVTRAILGSPAFADLDKRSLLAAVVKRFPYVQDMISGSGDRNSQDSGAPW